MKISTVVVGKLEENCYIVEKDNKVIVIDPGDGADKIKKAIGNRKIAVVLVTHSHFDHIGALSYFDNTLIYKRDNLEEGDYYIEGFKFKVIYTPGHSGDSVSYYFDEINTLFSGDFIFYENVGRCDLPSGNYDSMLNSINKISGYPDDMIIYPGHGIKTNLLHEKKHNIYFNRG